MQAAKRLHRAPAASVKRQLHSYAAVHQHLHAVRPSDTGETLTLSRMQFDALVLGLPSNASATPA